jgi:histone deacetylase 1/2
MTLQQPPNNDWYFDSGATSHMTSDSRTLSHTNLSQHPSPSSIIVGDGSLLPVTATGTTNLTDSLSLNNVLFSPRLIKNLISVRQFTTDNNCAVEFDPAGCSVKDLESQKVIIRCNSSGPLYPLHLPGTTALAAASSPTIWHRRLGPPGRDTLSKVTSVIPGCTKELDPICHACQLGRHTRLPFQTSSSRASTVFELIHCDLWTSPVISVSGFKYYLIILDDYSHYVWAFPLRLKSDTFTTLTNFFAYVHTQYGTTVKAIQCDNGREFDNSISRSFFLTKGIHLRMSCPYTSSQNGRAERMIRTINNAVRSLLFQASMPPSYWVEALHVATHVLNILPTKTLHSSTPHSVLFGVQPQYDHLRVFGCACYPNLSATATHKLAPRSSLCIFLGYSSNHKGYRCLDLQTNRVLISRHVVFDETSFPLSQQHTPSNPADFDFLTSDADPLPSVPLPFPTGTSTGVPARPRAAPPASTLSAPCTDCPRVAVSEGAAVQTTATTPVPGKAPSLISGARQATPSTHAAAAAPGAAAARQAASSTPAAAAAAPVKPRPLLVYSRRQAAAPPPQPAATSPPALPKGAVSMQPTINNHSMTTRAKAGHRFPSVYNSTTLSPVPRSFRSALADPNWRTAMEEEFSALLQNKTWELVPRPSQGNIVTGKWIFKHKFRADGSLERKARWVLRGFTQRPGIDFDETFSPVVKPATVRTVLSLALSRGWPVHQLDVKNAFLHGTLSETVFAAQPAGFEDSTHPGYVCQLNKSLYGLKQAPRAWYSRFATFILSLGFVNAKADTSLFIYHNGADTAYLLLYVDDIILTASTAVLRRIIAALQREFSMKDLGKLHHFLGMQVQHRDGCLFLSQQQYMLEILDRAGMAECKPCSTPVDTNPKLSAVSGDPVQDPSDFRSLAGALQYLTFTRPDIAYAVQQVCLHMHDPREPHLAALKRILRYVRGTLHLGLVLRPSSQHELIAYSDADWAGCPDTRKSTSGYAVFLGDNLISWSSKRQNTVSRSSAEAEYRAVANAVAETSWLRQLLSELQSPLQRATLVYCDNISAVYMSANPVQHQRTKHIEIDLHFVREQVALGAVRVLHVPTTSQYADIFTKGLPSSLFVEFRTSLNVRCTDAQTAGGC